MDRSLIQTAATRLGARDLADLAGFAAGAIGLSSLSKDCMIELHRCAFGSVGNSGAISKGEYADRLRGTPDLGAIAADICAAAPQGALLPAQAPQPAPATDATAAALAAAVQAIAAQVAPRAAAIGPEQLEALRAEMRAEMDAALAAIKPRALDVTINGETRRVEGRTHPQFAKILRLVSAGVNVLLIGPAGTGKTTLAHQVADALGLAYGALHCTAGVSESQLLGWLLPTGEGGRFEYREAPFARLYGAGNSLFLLDELDAADPNLLMVANGALANGSLHIPQRLNAPEIKRGDRSYIMAAANTYGTGADYVYAGRNQLDAATLDRFYPVFIDYDRELETDLAGQHEALLAWVWDVRERVAAAKLRRVVSTRWVIKGAAALAAGLTLSEIKADLTMGWSRDELSKVGM